MNSEISVNVAPVIENPGELVVPTITLYEVYKKLLALNSYSSTRGFAFESAARNFLNGS
jgi:hypothetical protein